MFLLERFFLQIIKLSSLACLVLVLTGCTIFGPIQSHDLGRSLGGGNHNFHFSAIVTVDEKEEGNGIGALPSFRYDIGVSENLDLGFQYELLSSGIRGKYSFLNNKKGLSASMSLGAGSSSGLAAVGFYYNATLATSYKADSWEPFLNYRFTYVDIASDGETTSEGPFGSDITFGSDDGYGQIFLGTKYWITEKFALSMESNYFALPKKKEFGPENVLFSVGIDWRW